MIKAIIVDDEKNSRELIKNLIEKHCSSDVEILALAENITKAEQNIRSLNPQLLFLDIEIAGNTGFDLLSNIQDVKLDVIFTTAFDHYALKAIKYSAIDYLLKPIDAEELKIAVEKIKHKQQLKPQLDQLQLLLQNFKQQDSLLSKISLPTAQGHETILLTDIIRCESDDHYTVFHTVNKKKIMVASTLKNYEDILPSDKFFRIHNSHIVNLEFVARITKEGYVVMKDDSHVEMSRRKKELFLQKLSLI